MDAAQSDRIESRRFGASKNDGLVAAHASSAVVRMRITTTKGQIVFRANDKESEGGMQSVETLEIDETAVHNNEGAGLWLQFVEEVYFVNRAARNGNKNGDSAVNLQQRVEFDRRFAPSKLGPGKE